MSSKAHRRAVCSLLAVALASGCGSDQADPGPSSTVPDRSDAVELFDATVVHSIDVEFDEADYDSMIATFEESGDKTWIEASVAIDGSLYRRAGLRLKGNSSLMGLRGGAGGDRPQPAGGTDTRPGIDTGADADSPEHLPWLIRLDEFEPDQLHQGYADIVVRSNASTTSLNEAVALDLLAATILASEEAVSTSFSVNGGDEVLRLATEHPDDDAWQERAFSSEKGALYKAESTGDWSYRGDDPNSYTDVFDQEGGKKVADLTPLIDLLQFVNESDDATFAAELPERLDVDAFATYLAMMELIGNFDDIDGPGNNAYLWWDASSEQFTVVPWDMNLAFSQLGGMPGGMPGGGGAPESMPEGFDPSQMPEGARPPGGGNGPRGFGGENTLVKRFHANAGFEEQYQLRLESLRSELFASGAAGDLLDERVATLKDGAGDLVEPGTVDEEASRLAEQFTEIAEGP